jgi:hypothetical protein
MADRTVLRQAMIAVPSTARQNFVLFDHKRVYVNRPELLSRLHLYKYVSGSGHVFVSRRGEMIAFPDVLEPAPIRYPSRTNTCGVAGWSPFPNPLPNTGPFRSVYSNPTESWSLFDGMIPGAEPCTAVSHLEKG